MREVDTNETSDIWHKSRGGVLVEYIIVRSID